MYAMYTHVRLIHQMIHFWNNRKWGEGGFGQYNLLSLTLSYSNTVWSNLFLTAVCLFWWHDALNDGTTVYHISSNELQIVLLSASSLLRSYYGCRCAHYQTTFYIQKAKSVHVHQAINVAQAIRKEAEMCLSWERTRHWFCQLHKQILFRKTALAWIHQTTISTSLSLLLALHRMRHKYRNRLLWISGSAGGGSLQWMGHLNSGSKQ